MASSFPRRYAATQRFTLGEPRNVTVSPDGERVVFLRSRGGDDPLNVLWVHRPKIDMERLTADPRLLLAGDDEGGLPPEERARRERLREGASGITSYATDDGVTTAAFALAGRLFVADLVAMRTREVPVTGPVFDPRPDPMGRRIAYVSANVLRIVETDGTDWELAGDDDPNVSWGSAEFVAAEEMRRQRGFWWAPDGSALVAARVDVASVNRWWVSDPAHPERPPVEHRYPVAGSANAEVSLHVLGLDGSYVEIAWDLDELPYLVDVSWKRPDRILLTVQSRDQCTLEVLEADPGTGATTTRWSDTDDAWVEIVPGVPALLGDGRLVTAADRLGARRLMVEGMPVTIASLQLRSVVHVGDAHVVFLANPVADPTVCHVWRWSDAGIEQLTHEPGMHDAVARGDAIVLRSAGLAEPGVRTAVLGGPTLLSLAEAPAVRADVLMRRVGPDRLAAAVLLPHDHDGGPLPVLVDSYGGPHAQRVVASHNAHVLPQWFADQGFAVVIIDGHGTPGRGSEWERAVLHDLALPVLEDQVTGLQALADELGVLDLSRVAIRGWSFGGYLAALAVMERPDVFHAAIAGAPVTDWRLYDTHYTERYLGHPGLDPTPYDRCSLIVRAADLVRPLLLIHGLADDNVVAAHTLQLSEALLAAGAPHEVLPLAGVSHMTPQEVVAENLLLHQLDFLRRTVVVRSSSSSHDPAPSHHGYGATDA